MKRILITIILVLGLLLVPSVVSAAGIEVVDRTGDGVWIDNTWEVKMFPGESKSTTLNLYNSSSSSLDVEVTVLPDLLDDGNLAFELDELSFTMSGGSHIDVTLTARASGSATPGVYTTELTIKSEVPSSRPAGGGGIGGGITRYLRVDLWGEDFKTRVTSAGEVKDDLEAISIDEMVTLYIDEGVLAQTEDEERLKKIVVIPMEESPPVPRNGYIIGTAYDFSPAGATFDPFIELEIRYDHYILPTGVAERDLVIAYYDEEANKWLELDGIVDTVGNTITAEVTHLTPFAIIGYQVVIAPAAFTISELVISPTEVDIGQSVIISAIVENTGGKVGIYEVVLKVDGVVEDTKKVVVSAGASKKVAFTAAIDIVGSWGVDVNGLSGLLMVKAVPSPIEPEPAPPLVPPTTPIEEPIPWGLIAGIVIGLALVVGGIVYWRKRKPKLPLRKIGMD